MFFENRYLHSQNLGRDMGFNVYGHAGKPILVFPSSGGSHAEYGDFGMIAACEPWITSGKVRFYTPDSYDNESWEASWKSPHDRALAHEAYARFIIDEFVPLIRAENDWQGGLLATGCSMGAYHAVNFGLKYPTVFDTVISLSGLYDIRFLCGDYGNDELVYLNSPVDYLGNLADTWFLEQYAKNTYIICTGLGPWEEVEETKKLERAFQHKHIPGWFDYWGEDVSHDWIWWRKQMPYYLGKLVELGQL
ncbi:esterase family protein [Ligilactobacillus apodemi]|uniref:Esterase n=1 Tax=Ligilactobacillus apodemi DSM 16634 = JCM 16172 TaxID=1423724 RepID=A0A0R1TYF5_9LACO|nr:alpha/beta hydrolase-fold protein [Ligilactobacillus apodemi]KRL83605.1 hypothetical protein FC32_GL000859 [Ligilactobacillus apodemi DSM 16634 = JCM 16172]MBD5069529.1 esterase family protein [Lactobacillus sp.]